MAPCELSDISRHSVSSTDIFLQGRTLLYTSLLKSVIVMET